MIITIKFEKGQYIWTMHKNKPYEFEVKAIRFIDDHYGRKIFYCEDSTPNIQPEVKIWHDEKECYATKSALIKSL